MKIRLLKSFPLLLLICLFAFSGCKTNSVLDTTSTDFELFQGETPDKKATWHCIKIDLENPQLQIQIIPETEQCKSDYLKNIARKNNAKVAINTTPFTFDTESPLVGITKVNGKTISSAVERYSALCFTSRPLTAHIIKNQTAADLEQYPCAIGGFFTILENRQIQTFEKIKRSRSAAGLSHNGRYLYLFATTPKFSLRDNNGMTYEECASLLLELGCTDAMQFDGGRSTGLYYNGVELEKPLLQRKVPAIIIIK